MCGLVCALVPSCSIRFASGIPRKLHSRTCCIDCELASRLVGVSWEFALLRFQFGQLPCGATWSAGRVGILPPSPNLRTVVHCKISTRVAGANMGRAARDLRNHLEMVVSEDMGGPGPLCRSERSSFAASGSRKPQAPSSSMPKHFPRQRAESRWRSR